MHFSFPVQRTHSKPDITSLTAARGVAIKTTAVQTLWPCVLTRRMPKLRGAVLYGFRATTTFVCSCGDLLAKPFVKATYVEGILNVVAFFRRRRIVFVAMAATQHAVFRVFPH